MCANAIRVAFLVVACVTAAWCGLAQGGEQWQAGPALGDFEPTQPAGKKGAPVVQPLRPRTDDATSFDRHDVRVVDAPKDSVERRALPKQFLWPSKDLLQSAGVNQRPFRLEEVQPESMFSKWLRAVIPAAVSEHAVSVYRNVRYPNVKYLVLRKPHSGYDVVRCASIPYMKSPWAVPDYLQIVTDSTYSSDGHAMVIQALMREAMKKEWPITKIDSAHKALEESVLADRFKRIPWKLIGYEVDLQFQTAAYRFAGNEEYLPFVLTVTLGPRGTLLQLEGSGFIALVEPSYAESLKRRFQKGPEAIGPPPTVRQNPN